MSFLGLVVLLFVLIIIGCCISSSNKGSKPVYYGSGYASDYDEDDYAVFAEEDNDDYVDYETSAARGDRDYFSDDPAQDYNSYYAQVADDAMMGDEGAIEEMLGEF